jgi:hypothetical protein
MEDKSWFSNTFLNKGSFGPMRRQANLRRRRDRTNGETSRRPKQMGREHGSNQIACLLSLQYYSKYVESTFLSKENRQVDKRVDRQVSHNGDRQVFVKEGRIKVLTAMR